MKATATEHKILMRTLRDELKEFSGAGKQIADMANVTPQAVSSFLRGDWYSEKIYLACIRVLKHKRSEEKKKIDRIKKDIA